ncbi:MAG: ribosome silencing factor [Clostridia bacterium]|nr:ribosome silencing factor [Clostridia bacterium]
MMTITPDLLKTTEGLVKAIASVLDEKQAENIKILKVEKQTSLCSYFIICDGRASTHVLSLADHVEDTLASLGEKPLHTEGMKEGTWAVLDYASVIVHIFDRQNREFYNLEKLWRDAESVSLEDMIVS